ncbi:hypothetical protein Droror1_Dr00007203 [Drosera rotundifolia]
MVGVVRRPFKSVVVVVIVFESFVVTIFVVFELRRRLERGVNKLAFGLVFVDSWYGVEFGCLKLDPEEALGFEGFEGSELVHCRSGIIGGFSREAA